ncbi:MAG: transposase [Candidatus Heimdallarchaeota archaeon]
MQKHENHCSKCGHTIKISDYPATIVYKCLECGNRISTATRICKKCGKAAYTEVKKSAYSIAKNCENCGYKEKKVDLQKRTKSLPINDPLFRKLNFSREIKHLVSSIRNERLLMQKFMSSLSSTKAVASLKTFMFPHDMLENITTSTSCDKAVEKSFLENIILWFFSTFMSGNYEQLAINAVAHNSAKIISRTLTDDSVISANALGVRLENDKLVEALEMFLEFDSFMRQSEIFTDNDCLKPVYYDWMYITKSGDSWKICNSILGSDEFSGFKIGIGMDWTTKSIVALTLHGTEHPNDALAFKRDLCIRNVRGLIHISDRGPFDSKYQEEISKRNEYFIIQLKDNMKYRTIHSLTTHNELYELSTPSKPKIKLLKTGIITLKANPDLGPVKYIKFQYNNQRTGRFETIELISNLMLDAIDIIELSAQRWISTETQFNILQHGFGLEKVFVKNPRKVWPLLLLALICKSLFERILTAIHSAHGGTINIATFKINLGILIEHIAVRNVEKLPLDPCNSIICPYRRKRGTRLK